MTILDEFNKVELLIEMEVSRRLKELKRKELKNDEEILNFYQKT